MSREVTPMMRQYNELKQQAEGCILFFRLGDFYEMFGEDAKLVSRELSLTLTTRDRNAESDEDRTMMCGVPYHSAESYIARLLKKGYKVAVSEQMEDPATTKGLVSREITRVITPGTVTEPSMLEDRQSNYIASVWVNTEVDAEDGSAVCFCDVSTGQTSAARFYGSAANEHILNELVRYQPAEIILSPGAAENFNVKYFLSKSNCALARINADVFELERCREICMRHFTREGEAAGRELFDPVILKASGALLNYLEDTRKSDLAYISLLSVYTTGQYMELDLPARKNLELTESLRSGEKRGSLLWTIDKTKTSMGGRMLRSWLEKPLLSAALIRRRLNAVEELTRSTLAHGEITRLLKDVDDIERLATRAAYGSANARDLYALATSAEVLPELKRLLSPMKSVMLSEISKINDLQDMRNQILSAISESPPFSVREGGFIRSGYSADVDRLRLLAEDSKAALAQIEARERERTKLRLKVGYTRVFGYYIEVTRGDSDKVPDDYIRKQTLTNAERFITPELRQLESEVLSAKDKLQALEYDLFRDLLADAAAKADTIREVAKDLASLDALCSLAEVAAEYGYCMPEVDMSDTISIIDGRHPVVERTLSDTLFVPNDTYLNGGDNRAVIITGPNMAGKSTFMRQTALIVLLAQIGSFVPAKSATIGIRDRIFTRIGASDDLAGGQSTFMVEMSEVASILRNATERSLIILDEIGRGTSTYDGMAIARATLEYCLDKSNGGIGAMTMFSTHYHELAVLENELSGVRNFQMSVKKRGEEIVFLCRVIPGGADRSYGVEVAKLAGLPERVIKRGRALLKELESRPDALQTAISINEEPEEAQISLEAATRDAVADKLRSTDLNTLSPIEAMNLLYELKQTLE
ncbi:MAG: DNA mismatch repair protein MutS [Oscillospiraceae bacterium]|jgi:DNA mismatch repair protein MutS|nr:DNA mismatch repair protein MutS [Oscillospiraceae bacterium]